MVITLIINKSLIIVSDVCLTMQAPVAQWLRHWSRKPEIPGSIPRAGLFFLLPLLFTDGEAVEI